MNKAPSFPFYVRDWIASPTRLQMTIAERGVYWDLLAFAWDSEPVGTLPKSTRLLAKITGISRQTLDNFFKKYPRSFVQVPDNSKRLYNQKLVQIAQQYSANSEKKSLAGKVGAASRWQSHAGATNVPLTENGFAVAVALASSKSNTTPPYPPASRGGKPNQFDFDCNDKTTVHVVVPLGRKLFRSAGESEKFFNNCSQNGDRIRGLVSARVQQFFMLKGYAVEEVRLETVTQ